MLNREKCKCIILPKTYPRDLSFSISDVQVPIVDHLELLGVTIDNSLNLNKHIGRIINKVGSQLDVLSRLKNTLSIYLFEDMPLQLIWSICNVLFYLLFCNLA